MDYFSKFKKRIVTPKAQPTSTLQLVKFHKCWDYVHNIFIAEDRKANLHVKQTEIPERLRQMVDMLVDEEARQEDNTTGVCMEYFLKHGLLQYLVNVSEKMDYPEGIRGESIRTIASMVDLLDDRFLVHNAVHKPTIKLLRFCVLDERQSELDHEDLVDLMYTICSKIHGFPALLNIFFHDKQWLTTPQKPSTSMSSTTATISAAATDTPIMTPMIEAPVAPPEYEFLLFTYLLRFIHREGRSGDYARTGLLFLMEMATDQLGDFILESDFATIMAAGLGALYSQLPRKLIIKDEKEINSTAASYLLGQDLDPRSYPSDEFGVEQSNSAQFKYQLDSFLKLLEFCQDVLLRCPNNAISERLLQCIRGIFMENILYPSILECSDADGSSVAVISYIDLILQIVQQQDLASVMVGFLMEETDDEEQIVQKLMMATPTSFGGVELGFKSTNYFTAAERFTLKDLIFTRLKSSSQPTVIATLKLLRTLIVKHCRFSDRLLSTVPDTKAHDEQVPPSTNVSHHIREIQFYFSLISAIDHVHADDILTMGYEDYLEDVKTTIEQDVCYQDLLESSCDNQQQLYKKPSSSKSERRRSFKYGQRAGVSHEEIHHQHQQSILPNTQPPVRQRIRSTDTLLQLLLGLLSHFFAQSSELNLALTSVISALALCPYRSLEGWVSFCESDRTNANDILHLGSGGADNGIRGSGPMDMSISNDIHQIPAMSSKNADDDDDDKSLDFGAERNSVHMTTPTQFKSFPPFYTLFRTLTQQVDYYRSEVDGFDALLDERWNGLLFGQTTMAAAPVPSLSSSTRRGSTMDPRPSASTSTATTSATSMVGKLFGLGGSTSTVTHSSNTSNANGSSNSAGSNVLQQTSKRRNSVASLKPSTSATTANLSKSLSTTTIAPTISSPSTVGAAASLAPPPPAIHPMSPLALHAKKTLQIQIQPLFPSNFELDRDPILSLDADDEDVFAPTQHPSQRRKNKSTEISLSMLLNNVVILEETIKELVAIMQVRRSLGIDRIRYT
ncbi:hypothetical protein PS15p_202305 [Mucor circinelloides]